MSVRLIKTTEQYRCDTESEAKKFIEEQRQSGQYEMGKYSSEIRQAKMKGEVVDEWYRVVLTKKFDDEKEPIGDINHVYYGSGEDNGEHED